MAQRVFVDRASSAREEFLYITYLLATSCLGGLLASDEDGEAAEEAVAAMTEAELSY